MNISQRLRTCAKHTGLDSVIELLQEAADEIDALQARAQVQGEPFGYIHHFAAHDESGALIDTTWEADGCADPLPHPTFPSMWKWAHCTPFYTTPQPAQATQAEVTDQEIARVIDERSSPLGISRHDLPSFARAILALRPVQSGLTGCNCRWDGDTQVQWCELHLAHKEAIHEWAERAKEAEKQLALRPSTAPNLACSSVQARLAAQWGYVRPERVPMTDTELCEALGIDGSDSWTFDVRDAVEKHHGITAQAKKETT